MLVSFGVHCMREMPFKRHVLVQVPGNAAAHRKLRVRMQAVSHDEYMHTRGSVTCMRDMLRGGMCRLSCPKIWQCMHASVGRRAPRIFDRDNGSGSTSGSYSASQ